MKAQQITNEPTFHADVEAFRNELNGLVLRRKEYVTALKAAEAKRFKDAGGCNRCHGRGWVVTWDTLDCMDGSCADYGACPEPDCTPEKRAVTGIDLNTSLKHDRWKGVNVSDAIAALPAYKAVVANVDVLIEKATSALESLQRRCIPVKGSLVVVSRGRSNVGTRGRVAFVKDPGAECSKVLIKDQAVWQDRKADGVWAYVRNVDVLKENV